MGSLPDLQLENQSFKEIEICTSLTQIWRQKRVHRKMEIYIDICITENHFIPISKQQRNHKMRILHIRENVDYWVQYMKDVDGYDLFYLRHARVNPCAGLIEHPSYIEPSDRRSHLYAISLSCGFFVGW